MQLANHHAHSCYSDGRLTPLDYLENALSQGLMTYGFSDHAPIDYEGIGAMTAEQLPEYLREVDRLKEDYRAKIEIYKGLEVDYIPDVISMKSQHIVDAELDYLIGAVHFVGNFPGGTPFSFEHSIENFERGILEIYAGDIKQMLRTYYGLIQDMVRLYEPDIVAHLDRIKKWNNNEKYFSEKADWYQNEIIETLEVIASTNCILEVNTKGYYRNETLEPYPGKWALRQARDMEIPVHLSSDAHHPDDITKGFVYGVEMLKEVGYKTYHILREGTWQPQPFLERKVYPV